MSRQLSIVLRYPHCVLTDLLEGPLNSALCSAIRFRAVMSLNNYKHTDLAVNWALDLHIQITEMNCLTQDVPKSHMCLACLKDFNVIRVLSIVF